MNYKDKHLIDDSAPDGFDLDQCPVYQDYLKRCDEERIRHQVKQELKGDINEYFEKTTETITS